MDSVVKKTGELSDAEIESINTLFFEVFGLQRDILAVREECFNANNIFSSIISICYFIIGWDFYLRTHVQMVELASVLILAIQDKIGSLIEA